MRSPFPFIALLVLPMLSCSAFLRHYSIYGGIRRILWPRGLSSTRMSTDEWDGLTHLTSGFVHHLRVGETEGPVSVTSVVDKVLDDRRRQKLDVTELSGKKLLELGAVWFLPSSAPKEPSLGSKPVRLSGGDLEELQSGDYLRIHFNPRRFPVVHEFDWGQSKEDQVSGDGKPGVIVSSNEEKGYMVIDKPNHVPVHMTVDNSQENVAECIRLERQTLSATTDEGVVYVSTPQRLDQNTSGLVVVATSKIFSAYFAGLLRNKTAHQLRQAEESVSRHSGNVHKRYRCLVCLQPPVGGDDEWSIQKSLEFLEDYQRRGAMRHFLKPSIRAPKEFVEERPLNDTEGTYAECLLQIANVGQVAPVVGTMAGQKLSEALWQDCSGQAQRIPPRVAAVVEIEVELLTGRTHQIRGQLSQSGFPLVGDALYGGAVPMNPTNADFYYGTERLALQCCRLQFRDPDIEGDRMIPSERWNNATLDRAWWSLMLEEFRKEVTQEADADRVELEAPARPDLLPGRVTLSPGQNKYVLIEARHPRDPKVQRFVKSASPSECGGPYHGNVAQEPRAWIEAANYTVTVTGGGRIDYQKEEGTACVYGFSYGFGRGDHILAASLINQHLDGVQATYDLSKDLY